MLINDIIHKMRILGIETSCDETAAAVVEDGVTVISSIISSQIDIHRRYGGIVPEVASRQHLITILPVIEDCMQQGKLDWNDIDAVAVTYGPGLAGSLLVGVNTAKAFCLAHNLPLIGINHLEGHIYANWLTGQIPVFPCLCLIISGGHSDLVLMDDHGQIKKIGQTRDDAAGEAFDKGARIIGLGYPGGPSIEAESKKGSAVVDLPRAWLKGNDDFSFSGLKTALLHLSQNEELYKELNTADVAASFQQAIFDVLIKKTIEAAKRLNVKKILLAGGVASNKTLNEQFNRISPLPVLIPPPILCTDNAAMIASCGYFNLQRNLNGNYDLDVVPGLTLPS
jgi:N6-L-threonylcarbamoyladenine synthase